MTILKRIRHCIAHWFYLNQVSITHRYDTTKKMILSCYICADCGKVECASWRSDLRDGVPTRRIGKATRRCL